MACLSGKGHGKNYIASTGILLIIEEEGWGSLGNRSELGREEEKYGREGEEGNVQNGEEDKYRRKKEK